MSDQTLSEIALVCAVLSLMCCGRCDSLISVVLSVGLAMLARKEYKIVYQCLGMCAWTYGFDITPDVFYDLDDSSLTKKRFYL